MLSSQNGPSFLWGARGHEADYLRQICFSPKASEKKRRKIDEKRNFCTSTEKKKRMTQINRNFEQQTQVNFNILYSKILNKAPVTEKARKFE